MYIYIYTHIHTYIYMYISLAAVAGLLGAAAPRRLPKRGAPSRSNNNNNTIY